MVIDGEKKVHGCMECCRDIDTTLGTAASGMRAGSSEYISRRTWCSAGCNNRRAVALLEWEAKSDQLQHTDDFGRRDQVRERVTMESSSSCWPIIALHLGRVLDPLV